jgi:phospholipid/cholesterol/gamma-HCH transport system substrate-binding protein
MKRRDEVLVGIVTTIALVLGVVGSLFLARGGLFPGYAMYGLFPWGSGLKQGQPVMLSGVTIGYVGAVDIRREGGLVIEMRIYKQYEVPRGVITKVAPNGFFGDMMIAMQPPVNAEGSHAVGDTLIGTKSVGVADVVAMVDSIGRDVRGLTQALRSELVEKGGLADVRRTVTNANALVVSLGTIAEAQSAELTKTQESLRRIANAVDSAKVDSTVRALGALTSNVNLLTTDLRTTTTRLNGVLARLEGTEGSAGLLMNDPGLYRDVRSLLSRLDSLTADFQKNPRKYINLTIF